MTNAIVHPASWRCRTCGESNPLHSRSCRTCPGRRSGPDPRALQSLFENAAAQVVNPGAEVVYNNIYNFAPSQGDVTVMTPQETNRAQAALEDWTRDAPQEKPKKRGRGILNVLLGMLTAVCLIIMTTVAVSIIAVVVLGTMKALGH